MNCPKCHQLGNPESGLMVCHACGIIFIGGQIVDENLVKREAMGCVQDLLTKIDYIDQILEEIDA